MDFGDLTIRRAATMDILLRRGNHRPSSATLNPLTMIPPADFVKRMSGLGCDMYIYRLICSALTALTTRRLVTYSAATRSYEPSANIIAGHLPRFEESSLCTGSVAAYTGSTAILSRSKSRRNLKKDLKDAFRMIMWKPSKRSVGRSRSI
ncbi:hypothetical protein E4U12_006452 [Claviceps purpurea]|nr:hypothetical protein E4U12_006452 [Claviceps purpurea]